MARQLPEKPIQLISTFADRVEARKRSPRSLTYGGRKHTVGRQDAVHNEKSRVLTELDDRLDPFLGSDQQPRDLVVLLSSTAHHKFKMYRKLAKDKNLRIHFLPVEMLHRTMAEGDEVGGSTRENADEKNKLAISAFNKLTPEKRATLAKSLSEIIAHLGLKDPNVIVATDDAGVSFDVQTWNALPKKGAWRVLKNLKESEGPSAEYGPFITARGGISQFLSDLRNVAKKLGDELGAKYKAVFIDKTTFTYQSLHLVNDGTDFIFGDKSHFITADDPNEIVFEEGIEEAHFVPSLVSPQQLSNMVKPKKIGENTLHESQRAQILDGLVKNLNIAQGLPATFKHDEKLKVAFIGNRATTANLLAEEIYEISKNTDVTKFHGDSLEQLIADNDGFVVICDNREDARKHVNYAVIINSIVVARQTDGRDFNKPFAMVEVVKEGSERSVLERIAEIHKTIAAMGMTKEGEYTNTKKIGKATVYYSNYFCYVAAPDQKSANAALQAVFNKEFGFYRRTVWEKGLERESRDTLVSPTDKTVAIMCSAGNQNDELYEGSKQIAKYLVSKGYNISYGAMDKYMGEAIISGYKAGRKIFDKENPKEEKRPTLIGVSTDVLLGRETARSKMNDEINIQFTEKTLERRTARILKPLGKPADIVTIMPGGLGTLIEKIEANMNNKTGKKTPIIVWNPPFPAEDNRLYDAIMKNLCPMVFHGMYNKFRNKAPEKMLNTQNNSADAKLFRERTGVYVVNSVEEYIKVFDKLSAEISPESRKQPPTQQRH